ncbi:MAG: hypothetical protein QG599_196 [Pseudomonadota bacterium]|nr:hypothetical protein [Pseudomonadota bacterium]
MYIEAELDEIHTERLLRLQQKLQKPVAEVVAAAIDALSNTTLTLQQETHGTRIRQILEEEGLVGCMEAENNLSVDYKNHLWSSES